MYANERFRRAYERRIHAIFAAWWILEIIVINKTKNFSEWITYTTRFHILFISTIN